MIWVFVAGGTGASLRVALVPLLDARLQASFPSAGTWIVNMLGCLAIGLGAAALPEGSLRPILLGGLLGGFTTFSAFSLDVVTLMERKAMGLAALYVTGSVTLSVLALFLGLVFARQVLS